MQHGARNSAALTTVAVTFPFSALLLLFVAVQAASSDNRAGTMNRLLRQLALLYAVVAMACFVAYLCMDHACAWFGPAYGAALMGASAVAAWACGACAVVWGYA